MALFFYGILIWVGLDGALSAADGTSLLHEATKLFLPSSESFALSQSIIPESLLQPFKSLCASIFPEALSFFPHSFDFSASLQFSHSAPKDQVGKRWNILVFVSMFFRWIFIDGWVTGLKTCDVLVNELAMCLRKEECDVWEGVECRVDERVDLRFWWRSICHSRNYSSVSHKRRLDDVARWMSPPKPSKF